MKYPRPIMTKSELCSLGFSRYYLDCVARSKYKEKFITRTSRTGKMMFDTEEFEKLRKKGVFG